MIAKNTNNLKFEPFGMFKEKSNKKQNNLKNKKTKKRYKKNKNSVLQNMLLGKSLNIKGYEKPSDKSPMKIKKLPKTKVFNNYPSSFKNKSNIRGKHEIKGKKLKMMDSSNISYFMKKYKHKDAIKNNKIKKRKKRNKINQTVKSKIFEGFNPKHSHKLSKTQISNIKKPYFIKKKANMYINKIKPSNISFKNVHYIF